MPLQTRTYRRLLASRPVTGLFLRQIPSTQSTVSPSGPSSLLSSFSSSTTTPLHDAASQTPRFFHHKTFSQKRPTSCCSLQHQSSATKAILQLLHGGCTSRQIRCSTTMAIRPFHSSISWLFAEKGTTSSELGVMDDVKETTEPDKEDSSKKDNAPEAPSASEGEAEAGAPSDLPPPPPSKAAISAATAEGKGEATSKAEAVRMDDVKETTEPDKEDSSEKDDAPEAPSASEGEAEAGAPSDLPPPPPSEAATSAATEGKDEATTKVEAVSPTDETSEAGPTTEVGSSSTDNEDADDGDDKVRATDVSYAFTPPPPLSAESQAKVDGLLERILWLDMIEVHLLTQLVHEQMGVSWQEAQMGMTGGGGGGAVKAAGGEDGEAAAPEEAKTIFDLKLVGFDAKAKIKVIKEVRTIAGLGLKEAKEMVEAAPKVIQKELKLEKAEELKAQLEAVGAEVELV